MTLLILWGNRSFPGQDHVSLFESRHLTADEIGLMQVAFGKSGLNEYEIRGTQVQVPREHRADYLKSLAEHGAVPQDLRAALETGSSFDFFQTRAQQRLQQIARKKQTIRDMVMQLRFVERATVDYDETRGATPFEDLQRTAVVNVCPADNRVLTLSEVKAIRDTVSGAVAGLQAEQITIIDTFGSKSHTGETPAEAEHLQPHHLTKMQAERKYETKIRSALTAYPGIRVNVEVGIDPVVRRVRDERNLDSKPVVVEQTIQRETSAHLPSFNPSILQSVFHIGANSQAQVEDRQPSQQDRSSERTQSLANGTVETTETLGPMVTHVSVSIGIPERCVEYFVERNAAGQQAEAEQIQTQRQQIFEQLKLDICQKVSPLVPLTEPPSNTQQIVVTLDRQIPLLTESTTPPELSSSFTRYWPWLLVLVVGLGCGLAFWRPSGNSSSTNRSAEACSAESRATRSDEFLPDSLLNDRTGLGAAECDALESDVPEDVASPQRIRGQLDQWCRENPHAAAATIRQWLERKAG